MDKGRLYNLERMCKVLNKIKNKDAVTLVVLTHEEVVIHSARNMLERFYKGGKSLVLSVPNDGGNYANKIRAITQFALENGHEFCVKLDGDHILHESIVDYLCENTNLLTDDVACVYVGSSNNVPTCERFIKDFFTSDETKELYDLFSKHKHGEVWGFDYNFLDSDGPWDFAEYQRKLIDSGYMYQGIHPVRVNNAIMKRYNEIVMKHIDNVNKAHEYYTYELDYRTYACNGFFMIKATTWRDAFNDPSLYGDGVDEVPLNRYCTKNKKRKLFIGNSFTIHPYYNSYPDHAAEEKRMFDSIFPRTALGLRGLHAEFAITKDSILTNIPSVDVFIKTTPSESLQFYTETLQPVSLNLQNIPNDFFRQHIQCITICDMISEYELKNNIKYDRIIITRPDLVFNAPMSTYSFDSECIHMACFWTDPLGGYSEDRFFLFDRKYMEKFRQSVIDAISAGAILHKLFNFFHINGLLCNYIGGCSLEHTPEYNIMYRFAREEEYQAGRYQWYTSNTAVPPDLLRTVDCTKKISRETLNEIKFKTGCEIHVRNRKFGSDTESPHYVVYPGSWLQQASIEVQKTAMKHAASHLLTI